MIEASTRSPGALAGRSFRVSWFNVTLFLVACKPFADAISERSRDDQLGIGIAWTALPLVVFFFWVLLSRTGRIERWILAATVIAILSAGVINMVLLTGVDALLENAKVAIGFVPAVLLFDATRRAELRRSLRRFAPVFIAALGLHVIVAWLQFAGLVSMTYQQAGSGRPSGLFFHPVTLGYLLVAGLLVTAVLHQRGYLGSRLAVALAALLALTVVIGTHRTSLIAALMVAGFWLLCSVVRVRRIHVRSLVVAVVLIGLVAMASVVTLPIWAGAAERAASGVTSVLSLDDLDPSSDRFLRGRGQRWAAALEAIVTASLAERLAGYGYQIVDPHSDYLRLPLVHGVFGSLIVLAALGFFWLIALRQCDDLGAAWLALAIATMMVFAITTKPTSFPSFMWAWTVVVAVIVTTRRVTSTDRAS